MNLPQGPFSVILSDPPWSYRDKALAGERGVHFKYGVMTDDEICVLPVAKIASPNSALYLWATPPNLPLALRVMESWEFTYKTIAFVWIKTYPKSGRLCFGMGNHTRANAEIVLLGIRGRGPQRIDAGVHSVVMSPRREHSRKPDEVRERIERLYGDVPRIELFARGALPVGWQGWGNQYEPAAIA